MKKIKATNLKPGMICEDWDNSGKKIATVSVIERPGYKYDMVRVVFIDGTHVKLLTSSAMNIQ